MSAVETETDYDFVIVGSGFGGAVSALRLAEKGYRVAVLEAGRRFTASDFPRTNWDTRKFLFAPRLLCYGIQRLTLLRDVLVLSGAGVGGGSLVFASTLPTPPAEIFSLPDWPEGPSWAEELAPHFATARRMLGAVTNPRLTRSDEILRECVEEMGRGGSFRPAEVAVFFGEPDRPSPDPYFEGKGPERSGCTFCGGCMVGCRFGAKNSLDKNYLYLAERLGVKIFPETEVDRIAARPEGGFLLQTHRTTAWFGGDRKRWHAPNVVLAAGALGTVDLLLRAREDGGLPRLSPALGRRARTNSETIVAAISRRSDVDFTDGVAITSSVYPDDQTHVEPLRYSRGSDVMGFLAKPMVDGGGALPRWLRFFLVCLLAPLDFLRSLLPIGWAKRAIILTVMQKGDSHLQLVRRRSWWWPFGRRLTSAPSQPGERRRSSYMPVAHEMARRVAAKIDGWPANTVNEVLLDVPTTAHILGGAAIGARPEEAVCDAQHRVFGHPGLYVIDGSSVPVNLSVNPSLTITAMAERAMAAIPPKT